MNLDKCLDQIYLFLAIIYFLNALYIFYRLIIQKSAWKVYTILYLFSYSFILFFCYFYFSGALGENPGYLVFNIPVLFILTAGAFVATRIIVYPDYRYSLKNLLHLFPAIVIAVYLMVIWQDAPWRVNREIPEIYLILCLADILFYLGYQIIEILTIIFFKKEYLKNRIYKNTIIMLLVIRSLNLGLPVMIFIEFKYGFSLQIIKLTGIFLALNSLLLTFSMAVYSYMFKVPRSTLGNALLSGDFIDQTEARQNQLKAGLEKAMNEMKLFKDEKLTLYTLSQELGVSPRLLSEYLNQSMKITFPEFLIELRINEAKSLFNKTDKSVSEVTYACGFNSSSKFYEHFRRKTGTSPAQYRKNVKNTSR